MIKTYARKLENIRNNCFDQSPVILSTKNSRSQSAKQSSRGRLMSPVSRAEIPWQRSPRQPLTKGKRTTKKLKIQDGLVAKKAYALVHGYKNQKLTDDNEDDSQVDIRIQGNNQSDQMMPRTMNEQMRNQNNQVTHSSPDP